MSSNELEIEYWSYDTGYGEVEGTLMVDYTIRHVDSSYSHHGANGALETRHSSNVEIEIDSVYIYYIHHTTELECCEAVDLTETEIQTIKDDILRGLV